jgi:aspartate-semialdehyde dehydrogenase
VALVGSESLLGRELRDLARDCAFELKLVAGGDEETGRLIEEAGEPVVLRGLEALSLAGSDAVLLAGSAESAAKALEFASGAALIDLTYAAENHPRARLRAPLIEPEYYEADPDAAHVVAHPAAVALALILDALHREHAIVRSLAHVFEPASERGRAGVEELQQQTVALLSFKGLEKRIFDAQLSFNLLAGYGEEAPLALADAELRIERHLATLLAHSEGAPMPSLRLVQAPVFHGHSFSLWVEFEDNPGTAAVERALASDRFDVRADMEPPNIVGMAGQDEIGIGAVTVDRHDAQACWIWAVADNVRLSARNALMVAQQVLDAQGA